MPSVLSYPTLVDVTETHTETHAHTETCASSAVATDLCYDAVDPRLLLRPDASTALLCQVCLHATAHLDVSTRYVTRAIHAEQSTSNPVVRSVYTALAACLYASTCAAAGDGMLVSCHK